MRIVSFEEFILLPSGTVFTHYEPQIFSSIRIKGDSIENSDFFESELLDIDCDSSEERSDLLYLAEKDPTFDIKTDPEIQMRDGVFEEDRLFAVLSKRDLLKIIKALHGNSDR